MTSSSEAERYERILAAISEDYAEREEHALSVMRMLADQGVVELEDDEADAA
jgi:hypothetical protein